MKFHFIDEPQLEFGNGVHVCPRAGITDYGVYDLKLTDRREKIFVGAVGTNETLEKLNSWLAKCSEYISAKPDAAQPNLFPAFCGFNLETGFRAEFAQDSRIVRPLKNSDIEKILNIEDWNDRVEKAVNLYYDQIKFLAQNRTVDVIICIIPDDLYEQVAKETKPPLEENLKSNEAEEEEDFLESNFRRALKAKAMHLAVPLQLVREISFEPKVKEQQDEATKAWNFCTALYYKANRQTVPWRLVTDINKPSACFVGISFYRSRDKKTLNTSLAQVFDELGNGVILRGTPVEIDKQDRRPHLSEIQAHELLKKALEEYKIAMNTGPGRLVLHKSSNFNDAEIIGFEGATEEMRVQSTDFITILDSDFRLFRKGIYPPYRGSHVELDKKAHALYTRGSVKYYRTQTSLYIPQPLDVRIIKSDESANTICGEILGLTKMNWNNTQFDGKYPITIACARRVGEVMKYLTDKDAEPQISYSFYM
jgi:argonaute-like protein implicated in RNA metabolism and viral defense